MMDISTVRTIAAMVPGERTRTLLLLLCDEVERLQHDVADLKMLRDEHQMDVMHAFQEGSEGERRKVVAYLRSRPGYGPVADAIESVEHVGGDKKEKA